MKYIIFSARFLALAIVLTFFGCTKDFDVKNAGEIKEYTINRPYFNYSLDYPVKITITGKIDGNARIYLTPQRTAKNSDYSISYGPNDRRKIVAWQVPVTLKKSILIYRPTTAKKGELNIKIEFEY